MRCDSLLCIGNRRVKNLHETAGEHFGFEGTYIGLIHHVTESSEQNSYVSLSSMGDMLMTDLSKAFRRLSVKLCQKTVQLQFTLSSYFRLLVKSVFDETDRKIRNATRKGLNKSCCCERPRSGCCLVPRVIPN